MAQYLEITDATISDFIAKVQTQHLAMMGFQRGPNAEEPVIKPDGCLWWRTDHPVYGECLMRWDGSVWQLVIKASAGLLFAADGSIIATDDFDLGGNQIKNIAAGTVSGDALIIGQGLELAGGTMTGDIDMDGHKVKGLPAATENGDALRYQDKWPTTCGVYKSINPAVIDQASDHDNTYTPCAGGKVTTFTPRVLYLQIRGPITLQAGGTLIVSGKWNFIAVRYTGDDDPLLVGTITGSGQSINVYVEWKYDAPRGFWLTLKQQPSNAYCDCGLAAAEALFGVGQ